MSTQTAARPMNIFKFVGFEEQGKTVMINLHHVVSLEDTSQGKKPRLEVFLVGDAPGAPRYTLALTIKEFFEHCRLL